MKKIIGTIFILLLGFVLVACKKEDEKPIDLSKVEIKLTFEAPDNINSVTKDFDLPVQFDDGVTATWVSNNEEVIKIEGNKATVVRSTSGDVKVLLTPTLEHTPEEGEKVTLERDGIEVTVLKLDLTPVVQGDIYHWMPDSRGADVTATVNLHGVDPDEVTVKMDDEELIFAFDYEFINDDEFVMYGGFMMDNTNELGDYTIEISTEYGTAEFKYHVVDNPEGTSIPTKEILVADMGDLDQTTITEPIAGAPRLMITEVAADAGKYSYVEVFNNSTEKVNLKGHLLVWGGLTDPINLATIVDANGLISYPMGTVPFYINDDVELEPFETGLIWYIRGGNRIPWNHEGHDLGAYQKMIEVEGAQTWLFDWQGGNLTLEGFREEHGIDEDVKVAIVRDNAYSINNTTAHNEDGFGLTVFRGGGFGSVNSGVANRAVQILYLDPEIKHDIHVEDIGAPAEAKYFKLESGILNPEEIAYVDGVFDYTKLQSLNGTNTTTPRYSINTFYTRMAYYDKDDVLLGYDKRLNSATNAVAQSTYAAPMYVDIAKQSILSTALVFPTFDEDGATARWGIGHGMEYTLPSQGSHIMRFIPRAKDVDYLTYINETYTNEGLNAFVKLAISEEIEGMLANRKVIVPENSAYVYEIPTKENSAGVTSNYNLGVE